jgi:ribosomal protein S6--L-glutamate ligase
VENRQPQIITDNDTLFNQYHTLQKGDLVVGRVRLRPGEESMLVDLAARGIDIFPTGLSQLISRSKALQSKIFSPYMVPHTVSVYDLHGLTEAINHYGNKSITQVITKHDRRNAGMGVHLWSSIEEVYNHASLGTLLFPFVLQPFQPNSRDIRVIIIDNYEEAYWRINPDNFRNNLHCGGQSKPCRLTEEQRMLCQQVMARGRFPYAHVDLLVTGNNTSYLGEINLRGGLRGAKINPGEYQERIQAVHESYLQKISGHLTL